MQKKKGISLVVLVITIIVMIILAGTVVISLNNSGIFNKAEQAVNATNLASINEMLSSDAYVKLYSSGDLYKYTEEQLQEYYENYLSDNGYKVPTGYVLKVNKNRLGVLTEKIDATAMKGTGTEADPYQVNCIEHLVLMAQAVNSTNTNVYSGVYFKLMRSLDFKDNLSYADESNTEQFGDYNADGTTSGIKTELTTGKGWTAIGHQATVDSSTYALTGGQIFCGNFDGNGKTIENLYINVAYTGTVMAGFGLFGASKGTIENLTVTGNVTASSTAAVIGVSGILSQNDGIIRNCVNKVNITSNNNTSNGPVAGGVTGITAGGGTIENCKNYGTIVFSNLGNLSYSASGGITGYAVQATVNKCENYGNVSGYYVGGITGSFSYSTIANCSNTANITGEMSGGIAGSNLSGGIEIINCYNVGSIERYGICYNASDLNNVYNIGEASTQEMSYYPASGLITITDYATLLTNLNTYVTENSSTSTVELSTWKIGANGYPVFDWQ